MLEIYLILIIQLFASCNSKPSKIELPVTPKKPVITRGYFRSPVDHEIKLAGTFCELRPNHFHTGIDIKSSTGSQGDLIYAIADGYVSRIGISPTGYGNALYIDHPNGFTSVYGHLQSYSPEIDRYALAEQERQKRFDIQYYPDSTLIRIKKGQVIARMGNTGSSNGAHLHFEIRETASEMPVNPLLFGYQTVDKMAPGISYARIYELDKDFNEFNAKNLMAKKRGPIFCPVNGDTITTLSSMIGLGINTRDGQEGNWNKNGVYDIAMYVNDSLVYHITMDSVSFEKTRMINAHLDYPEQRLKKNYVHKCYSLPGNTLPIIKEQMDRGVILLRDNEKKKIRFTVMDFNHNISVMEFFVKKLPGDPAFKYPPYNYYLAYDKGNIIQDTGIKVNFTDKTFFKNQNFGYKNDSEKSSRTYSNLYTLGNPNIPAYDYYSCSISSDKVPDHLRNKAFIASCDEHNKESNWGGNWEGNTITAPIRAFGTFYIAIDTIPPTVTPVVFGKNLAKVSRIVFRIDDNIIPAGQTPYLNYQAFIDDIWIPMAYDLKTKTISYVFPKEFSKGEHNFRLEVFDSLKNTKVYTSTFIK